ncbi:MAG: peptide chain release factor N(5)-glutamine methyltransferase [Pyrinomonadaceae bacterium]
MTVQSISEAIDEAAARLTEAGVAEPRREAASLLGFVLEEDRAYLIMNANVLLSDTQDQRFSEVLRRRAAREPFQHITGVQEFFGLDFVVNPDVLIPRPETELLVEKALDLIRPDAPEQTVCDVGTGSGCIIVTLLHDRSQLRGVGLDISRSALVVAAQNALTQRVNTRLDLRESDCFSAIAEDERFTLITANPPYITEEDHAGIQPEVREYEPRLALTPGGDGLDVVRTIVADAPRFLLPGGHLLMEIGYDQADAVRDLFDHDVWMNCEILPDLQGIPRCVVLRRV